MKNTKHNRFSSFLIIFISLFLNTRGHAQDSIGVLNGNNLNALFNANGRLFWDGVSPEGLEAPKGSGKHSIFVAGLWIGGYDNTNLRLAAETYRQNGADFFPGPLDTIDGTTNATTMAQWNKVFKITQFQIDSFRAGLSTPASILGWPGGNEFYPYEDISHSGYYDPSNGDYPIIKGDEMLWWIFNDNGGIHKTSGAAPIGVEVHAFAYIFDCDTLLRNTVFLHFDIVNRGSSTLNKAYMGLFTDFDLGYALDDRMGCDTALNTYYVYNGENPDPGTTGYGINPPAMALTYVQGIKNDSGAEMNMTNYMQYNNDNSQTGNPTQALHYYNYMRSEWTNGKHLQKGGNGYSGSGSPTNFIYPGNPANTNGWSEVGAHNPFGDRRGLGTFGPVTLAPGGVKSFTAAYTFIPMHNDPQFSDSVLKPIISQIINNYKNDKLKGCGAASGIAPNNFLANEIKLYPDPAENFITLNMGKITDATVTIYNIHAERLKTISNVSNNIVICTSDLKEGMYFIHIQTENNVLVKKFVKTY